jgi:protein O-mannosyl-transferase
MTFPSQEKNPSTPAGFSSFRKLGGFYYLLLLAFTLIAYLPAWNGKPVWDDREHFTNPALYSLDGFFRIWTQPGSTRQYYPLVHSVFWLQHKLWGYQPLGYHLTNILLHAFSALLLLRILRQLELSGAWLAASIFALHPIQVESVAWISELKNALSGICYIASAFAYLNYDKKRKPSFYWLALGIFLLGLMSKTVIATLPAALLVVFWWKRGRLSWKRDMIPLIPFFGLGLAFGLFSAWVERKFIGAEGAEFAFTWIERFLIAGRAFWFYLGKLLWPAHLIFSYPRWNVSESVWWQYLFPLGALLFLIALWFLKRRGLLAGLLFFSCTLFPALGFLNVYPFRFSFVADHFQYLASIGPISLVAAGMTKMLRPFEINQPRLKPVIEGLLLMVLFTLTWRQCRMYTDNETLWRTTVERNPSSWMPHDNLGVALLQNGKIQEAISEHVKAIKLNPKSAETYNNLANALLQNNQVQEAVDSYAKSIEINPSNPSTHYNLGNLLLFRTRQLDDAILHLEKCLEIEESLKVWPGNVYAHYDLGIAFYKKGRAEQSVLHYQKALKIQPDFFEAQNNLVWILATSPEATVRNGAEALGLALQSDRITDGDNPVALRNLAAAYAEVGRFSEAVQTAQHAYSISILQTDAYLAESLLEDIKLYQIDRPLRDIAP